MTCPPVTWLLPVKNAMPFLAQTLRSLADQTYANHRVLAWDNGSTDGSADELARWIGDDKPLRGRVVLDRPMNLGASLAAMVERADTELCARIDADDVCLPDRLDRQVRFMRSNPRVSVLGGGVIVTDAQGRTVAESPAWVTDDADLRWHLRFGNAIAHPTVMFRRSAVLACGNYADLSPGQDYDLWCRIGVKHRLANLAEPLVRYRMHDRSVTAANQPRVKQVSRNIRQRNLERLWPGLTVEQWDRLTHLLTDPEELHVSIGDWRLMRAVATRAAIIAGEDPRYFRRTARYRAHAAGLLTRTAKRRPVIRNVWPVLRRLFGPLGSTELPTAPTVKYQPRSAA